MSANDRPFKAIDVGAGLCMTTAAFAAAADVPVGDVHLSIVDWSDVTIARCIFVREDAPPLLTAAGVRLLVELLVSDQEAAASIERSLLLYEDGWLDRVISEPRPPSG